MHYSKIATADRSGNFDFLSEKLFFNYRNAAAGSLLTKSVQSTDNKLSHCEKKPGNGILYFTCCPFAISILYIRRRFCIMA